MSRLPTITYILIALGLLISSHTSMASPKWIHIPGTKSGYIDENSVKVTAGIATFQNALSYDRPVGRAGSSVVWVQIDCVKKLRRITHTATYDGVFGQGNIISSGIPDEFVKGQTTFSPFFAEIHEMEFNMVCK